MIVNRKANFFYKVLNILSVMASIDSSMFTQWNSSNPSLFESWHLACKLLLYHLVYITNCSQGILHCTVGDSSNKKKQPWCRSGCKTNGKWKFYLSGNICENEWYRYHQVLTELISVLCFKIFSKSACSSQMNNCVLCSCFLVLNRHAFLTS